MLLRQLDDDARVCAADQTGAATAFRNPATVVIGGGCLGGWLAESFAQTQYEANQVSCALCAFV